MNRVIIEGCQFEAEGRRCRQDDNRIRVKLPMHVETDYASGYDHIKAVGFKDPTGGPIEKAWIDRLRNGEGECAHCGAACHLRIGPADSDEVVAPGRATLFDQTLKSLFG